MTIDLRLKTGRLSRGDAAGDILSNVEGITGSAFNDRLIGNDNDENWFDGGAGADHIDGGIGNNIPSPMSIHPLVSQ